MKIIEIIGLSQTIEKLISYCMNCTNTTVSNPANRCVHGSKKITTKNESHLNRELLKMNLIAIIFNSIYKTKRKYFLLFMVVFTTGSNLVGEIVFPNGFEDCYLLSADCSAFVKTGSCRPMMNSNKVVSSAPITHPDQNGYKQSEKTKCGLVYYGLFPNYKKPCGGQNAMDACDRPSYM